MTDQITSGTPMTWRSKLVEEPPGEPAGVYLDPGQAPHIGHTPTQSGDVIWLDPEFGGGEGLDLQLLQALDGDLSGDGTVGPHEGVVVDPWHPAPGLGGPARLGLQLLEGGPPAVGDPSAGQVPLSDPTYTPAPMPFGPPIAPVGLGPGIMGTNGASPLDAAGVLAMIDALPQTWPLGAAAPPSIATQVDAGRPVTTSAFSPAAAATGAMIGAAAAAEASPLLTPLEFQVESPTGDAFLNRMASIASATSLDLDDVDDDLQPAGVVTVRSDGLVDDPDPELLFDDLLVGEADDGAAERLGAIASGAPTGAITSSTVAESDASTPRRDELVNEPPTSPADVGGGEETEQPATAAAPGPIVDSTPADTASSNGFDVEDVVDATPDDLLAAEAEAAELSAQDPEPTETPADVPSTNGTPDPVSDNSTDVVDPAPPLVSEPGDAPASAEAPGSAEAPEAPVASGSPREVVEPTSEPVDTGEPKGGPDGTLVTNGTDDDGKLPSSTDASSSDADTLDPERAETGIAYPPAGTGVPPELAAQLLDLLSPIDDTRLDNLEKAVLDEPATEPLAHTAEEDEAAEKEPVTEPAQVGIAADVPDPTQNAGDPFETSDDGDLS